LANRPVLYTGISLLAASIIIPLVMFSVAASSHDWANAIGGIVFAFVLSPILFIAGIIMIIVGASRGRQQQQQQVVIMPGAPPGLGARPCPSCAVPMALGARFCTHCGAKA
jgi:hypothetical protein